MEIIVGSIPPLQPDKTNARQQTQQFIEARLLNVRPPRKGVAGPSGMERRNDRVTDPRIGRILTIMIPDARQLPADIDTSRYDISLRLIRK